MRPAWCLVLLFCAACLDNAGPEDHPAQEIRFIAAPEGEQFPTDTLDEPIAVRVTDQRGNPSPGRSVVWTATGGGTLVPTSATTDAAGVARATWILGMKAGTQAASAAVAGSDVSVTIQVETAGWRVAAVSASRGNLACAIDPAADAWCWSGDEAPGRVATTTRFRQIATGWLHICGLSTNGRVYCWGNNDLGQIGDGTTVTRPAPTAPILPDIEFISVTAGHQTTCAATADHAVYCWGRNTSGQLGRGFASSHEAVPALVGGGIAWRSISPGNDATCGVDVMQRPHCWGEGDGDTPDVMVPTLVPGLPSADTVAVSDWQKCALVQSTLYCWGLFTSLTSPTVQATGIRSISAGYKPIFGLGTDGFGYYWGAVPNSSYGWGDPPTRFEGDLRFRAVGGNDYAPLAIELETSTLYRWTGWQFDAVRRPLTPTPVRPPGS